MGRYLGLDVGTTSISALILDAESGQVVAAASAINSAETTSAEDRARGRSEWDIERMTQIALGVMAEAGAQCGGVAVDAVGVTGQQHGMVLVRGDGGGRPVPLGPFIGWQDRRGGELLGQGQSYVERMMELGGEGFARSGCRPATGYLGTTLFWLAEQAALPRGSRACFAADYVVGVLCEREPVADATNAASAGILDLLAGEWDRELMEALGLSPDQLPPLAPSCTQAGRLSAAAASAIGLPAGVPVAVGCGDNQASFAGSVAQAGESVLLNLGTGGQVSVFVEQAPAEQMGAGTFLRGGMDLRPFLQRGFLLVGTAGCGGRSYRALRDFILRVGRDVFGLVGLMEEVDVYERLTELAGRVGPGADGLSCEPVFTGSRREPGRRAVWRGMDEANFTPGHLARALLEGIVEEYRALYGEMRALGVEARSRLVGAGNGIRKNALLREIASQSFGLPMAVAPHAEEAALGAALVGAVACGEFRDVLQASAKCVGTAGGREPVWRDRFPPP